MRIEAFLSQSPIVQITRVARRVEASLNLVLREEGVTFFEALVLAAIFFEKKGGIQPSHLAETFQTSRGNVSHCISSLEAKGLVARKIDPEDARALRLVLQPAGRKRAVRVVGILDRMQRHFEQTVGVGKLQSMLGQMGVVEKICSQLAGRCVGRALVAISLRSCEIANETGAAPQDVTGHTPGFVSLLRASALM